MLVVGGVGACGGVALCLCVFLEMGKNMSLSVDGSGDTTNL